MYAHLAPVLAVELPAPATRALLAATRDQVVVEHLGPDPAALPYIANGNTVVLAPETIGARAGMCQ